MPRAARAPISLLLLARQLSAGTLHRTDVENVSDSRGLTFTIHCTPQQLNASSLSESTSSDSRSITTHTSAVGITKHDRDANSSSGCAMLLDATATESKGYANA